ncbi:hypothetical protein SELMODRAFT_427423 [Selaginella moellendorffii]|uniref:Uncharacterized protein n=1 Tax=Selaginella moellendorffii TaxID=88036 RepID=D8SZJ4_SELML|nr:hypothetical protein SELMODRAFT_427423 [Selaginella moellendorffii]
MDEIGGSGFSRTRKFDDAARKDRIFHPKSAISVRFFVDVTALERQIQEKTLKREIQEDNRKKLEHIQAYQLHKWNQTDEKLRQGRIELRRDLEDKWRKQDDEFQERWKKKYHVFNAYDPITIVPAERYMQQDQEATLDATRKNAVNDVVARQIQENVMKKQQEEDEYWAYEHGQMGARARLKRCEEEIANKLRLENELLSEDHLHNARLKREREQQYQQDEHNYQIHHSFFDQFGSTSR